MVSSPVRSPLRYNRRDLLRLHQPALVPRDGAHGLRWRSRLGRAVRLQCSTKGLSFTVPLRFLAHHGFHGCYY